MSLVMRKPVLCHMRTAKVQISLRMKPPVQMFLSISLLFVFSRKFCQTKVTVKRQYKMVSLGSALLDSQLLAFSDWQQISYRNGKRPLQVWKKLALTFSNVTMDICYKTMFYFVKQKDRRIKNKFEDKIAHTKQSVKTCLWPKTLHATLISIGCLQIAWQMLSNRISCEIMLL